jgi:hypothetical protein
MPSGIEISSSEGNQKKNHDSGTAAAFERDTSRRPAALMANAIAATRTVSPRTAYTQKNVEVRAASPFFVVFAAGISNVLNNRSCKSQIEKAKYAYRSLYQRPQTVAICAKAQGYIRS